MASGVTASGDSTGPGTGHRRPGQNVPLTEARAAPAKKKKKKKKKRKKERRKKKEWSMESHKLYLYHSVFFFLLSLSLCPSPFLSFFSLLFFLFVQRAAERRQVFLNNRPQRLGGDTKRKGTMTPAEAAAAAALRRQQDAKWCGTAEQEAAAQEAAAQGTTAAEGAAAPAAPAGDAAAPATRPQTDATPAAAKPATTKPATAKPATAKPATAAPRPSAVAPTASKPATASHAAKAAALARHGQSSVPEPAMKANATPWACAHCTFENHKILALACDMCGLERATDELALAPAAAAEWNCIACTFVNPAARTICEVCATARK